MMDEKPLVAEIAKARGEYFERTFCEPRFVGLHPLALRVVMLETKPHYVSDRAAEFEARDKAQGEPCMLLGMSIVVDATLPAPWFRVSGDAAVAKAGTTG